MDVNPWKIQKTIFVLIFVLLFTFHPISGNNSMPESISGEPFSAGLGQGFQDFISLVENFDEEGFLKRQKALEKSNNIKGVYLTEFTAGSEHPVAQRLRDDIKKLLKETELTAVVIDVKEVRGPAFPNSLKSFIEELRQENIWVIARIVAFRDSSLINEKPEWYLKDKTGALWRDEAGYYWLDPACQETQNYLLEISKKAIDWGFDEIQFDYVRFPDRGDLTNISYPCYQSASWRREKSEAINNFYLKIGSQLRNYKVDIILSIDLFGLTTQYLDLPKIGQNLTDTVGKFDYISPMLYPSHYFGGFAVQADLRRGLPALYFPYLDENIDRVVSGHPYEVVSRSLFQSLDYISSFTPNVPRNVLGTLDYSILSLFKYFFEQYILFLNSSDKVNTKIRPWLQDFDLKFDKDRGIYYDEQKVRAQIEAAGNSGASGWLLWNSANIYTKEALKPITDNQ